MKGPDHFEIDPRDLRLPGSRMEGADPAKLQRQISRFGRSMQGMPPILVSRSTDGEYVINDGATRATRIAKLCPGQKVRIEVVDTIPTSVSKLPTIAERLP